MSTGRSVTFIVAIAAMVGSSGFLLRAEPPQAVGTWASMGTIADSRTGAASVALPDGRTLVVGGTRADGSVTGSIAILDPSDNSMSAVGELTTARAGHTATLLADGRVLVAGGSAGGLILNDLEIVDVGTGTSTPVGLLTDPRTGHAAARLADGKVLIVGGATIDGLVLDTAELFDPETFGMTPATFPMSTPRVGATATELIDHRVLIVGGSNGMQDLASAEIFEPWSQLFQVTDTQLSVARSGHAAVLLPNNNSVLIAGGISAGVPVTTTDLFLTAEFPDPYSYGMGRFGAAAPIAITRSGAIGGPATEGYAFVTGGGSSEAERYRFATVKTDKDDYAPGQPALITGSGWEPNSEVTLVFQEDPAVHDDYLLHVPTDGDGNFSLDTWSPERHDLGVRFYLTVKDSTSRAQITFTDAEGTATSLNAITSPLTAGQLSVAFSGTVTGTSNQPGTTPVHLEYKLLSGGNPQCTGGFTPFPSVNLGSGSGNARNFSGTFTAPAGGTYFFRATFEAVSGQNGFQSSSSDCQTITVNAVAKTTPTITFDAAPTPTFGGGNFTVNATTTNTDSTALTYSYVSGPCSFVSGSTFSSTGAGTCVVKADGAETANFNAASATQDVTIDKASQAITFGPLADKTYGDPDFSVSATGGASGEPVTFAAVGNCTVDSDGNPVHITGAGSCTITASQAGNANYYAAPDVPQAFDIDKASQTITFGPLADKTYGDPDFSVSATGGASGEPVTFAGAGNCTVDSDGNPLHITGAGSCTITASQAGNANYYAAPDVPQAFDIDKADQTIVVDTAAPASAVYNATFDVAAHATSGLDVAITTSGVCTVTVGGTNTATVKMTSGTGTCTVHYNQAGGPNYNAAPEATESTTAAKATQTITLNAGSPLTYNTTETLTTSGSSGTGAVTFGLTSGPCTLTGDQLKANSGTGSCVVETTIAADDNYFQATDDATVTLAKATQTITLNAGSPLTYNTTETLTTSGSSGTGAVTFGLTSGPCTVTGDQLKANSGTGSCVVEATIAADDNYLQASDDATVTLAKADQTIVVDTAAPTEAIYNTTFAVAAHATSGLDVTITVTGVCTVTVGGTNTATVKMTSGVGTCTVHYNQAGDTNYKAAPEVTSDTTAKPRAALVNYIGQLEWVTSGTSSTTAQVTLSASAQDPTGSALVGATAEFKDITTGKVLASGVKVTPVPNSPDNTATANTTVTLSSGQYGAEAYDILVTLTGNYTNATQAIDNKTATVVVMKPAGANEATGEGHLAISSLIAAAGTYRPEAAESVTFTVGMKYNKGGTNPQGKITLALPQADGTTISVKSNSISSMALKKGSGSVPDTMTIYTKASLARINGDGSITTIEGGVTLRMDIVDYNSASMTNQVGFTVMSSKTSELYYSSNWALSSGAWQTLVQAIASGMLSVN